MALASLIVALIAVVFAGLSAYYTRKQANEARLQTQESRRQFELAGPQVSVFCTEGDLDVGGMHTRAIAVTARNDGRGPVTIRAWGLTVLAGDTDVEFRLTGQRLQRGELAPLGPAVPCELGGNSSLTWKAPSGQMSGQLRSGGAHSVRPYVTIATGDEIHGLPMSIPPGS